jgi:hypothetical protein
VLDGADSIKRFIFNSKFCLLWRLHNGVDSKNPLTYCYVGRLKTFILQSVKYRQTWPI